MKAEEITLYGSMPTTIKNYRKYKNVIPKKNDYWVLLNMNINKIIDYTI
jgi:hypothetical protein